MILDFPGFGFVLRLFFRRIFTLEQSGRTADGGVLTTWQLEIPMRNAHDSVPLQVKFQREDPPEKQAQDKPESREIKDQLWRVELAFDLAPLRISATRRPCWRDCSLINPASAAAPAPSAA